MRVALDEAQRLFAAALRGASGDAGVLPLLRDADAASSRLALYRAGVAATQANTLANAYPVVRAIVGVDYFDGLSRAYAQASPSRSGDLHDFGADLSAFCARPAVAGTLPYLADVASLEWLAHRARFAADAQSLTRSAIATLTPAALLDTRFTLSPACAWIASRFPVASLWRAHQPAGDVPLPADLDCGEVALVVRCGWRVDVLVSCRAETEILAALRAGEVLAVAMRAGGAADPDFDFPRALVRWLDVGLLGEGGFRS